MLYDHNINSKLTEHFHTEYDYGYNINSTLIMTTFFCNQPIKYSENENNMKRSPDIKVSGLKKDNRLMKSLLNKTDNRMNLFNNSCSQKFQTFSEEEWEMSRRD